MIDPKKITDFNRSDSELQEFWLFCIAVAGKTASQIAVKIDDFPRPERQTKRPTNSFAASFLQIRFEPRWKGHIAAD